ncbi:uncharacterized protein LOC122926964 [Bufo gargarizans]|uniref:uncharacterized protein LOC122926964 n=1 Tax=Bufo gargarizans TaxID=30331 RepID=UPI001CF3B0B6|nr:uncharacterized protein LOC122926964 [Bufo gargarizans]XP_044134426.1 uncharacterized protein LOC122926964 [Bufo gargarizans]XP_044134427.1 uncharacterized protein LOC122926964 [Bufo gargarizans]
MSGVPMAFGGQQLMSLVGASVSPATWRGHGKAWADWLSGVGARNVATQDSLRLEVTVEWLLKLRSMGVSAPVAQRRLSGVAFFFRLCGWPDVSKHFVIRQAMKGWKKEYVLRDRRRPISFGLLCRLVEVCSGVCASAFEATLFSACFSLAFFAALRVGELLPPSGKKPGGLLFQDVVCGNGALRVLVRRSKTDQFGRGVWIPLHQVAGVACPVRLVSAYCAARVGGTNFFTHQDVSPLTKFQFVSVFRACLLRLGVDPKDFGTHSFRIGAATEAARAGLPESEVMRIGRWQSACYARYIRPDLLI